MKFCPNPNNYHGDVQKQIPDNEDYCLICKGKLKAEKERKKENAKKKMLFAGKVLFGMTSTISLGMQLYDKFKQKKSKKS